ncbi:hypothetical protein BWI96_01620 [Siphonobacter sp. SORGH_AS_0500]|uniref:hypothetical protein n=1 Tax=Siphonobacter sp. SORGH_AS_0500 TaxID=1864824 RepID=UPI000CC480EF|nr:hypothetical protein [Siphonobacter sp. SORGH_AS_0500]PKK38496.1 hypothetical protein BWI96_01620 [Siphonobacter sp. SORGH_AS_0500]
MFNRHKEKHAGTSLGSATADTNLVNNQGSSSEAGKNSTITQPIEKPVGGPYDPEEDIIEKEAGSEKVYGEDPNPEAQFLNDANATHDRRYKDLEERFPEDDELDGDQARPERDIPLV